MSVRCKPNSEGGSMPGMPSGPCVTSIQFTITRSKICWKLMVIMAR